jgi:hypothetical protein
MNATTARGATISDGAGRVHRALARLLATS